WLTTITSPFTSTNEVFITPLSSGKIRRLLILLVNQSISSCKSSFSMPKSTKTPVFIDATCLVSIVTLALETRCITAFIHLFYLCCPVCSYSHRLLISVSSFYNGNRQFHLYLKQL